MTGLSDTSPDIERRRLEGLRAMPAWRKLQLVDDLNRMVAALALAGLRQRYPHDSEARLRRRMADLILGDTLAAKAYGPLEESDGAQRID